MHYDEIIAQNQAWIDETWAKIEKKATKAAVKSRNKIPYTTDANGDHTDVSRNPHMWTNGFWGAYMWMMYEATKNEDFAITASQFLAVSANSSFFVASYKSHIYAPQKPLVHI